MARSIARTAAFLGISFVVALTSACGGAQKNPETPAAGGPQGGAGAEAIGSPAPDLSIQTLNGKGSISLASLRGKVVVVDFWATWCGPCKEAFPKLEQLSKQNAGSVVVVGVAADDTKDGVLDWARAQGATFPIGWDDGHSIAKRWNVSKMPTTFILDGSGTVRFVHEGYHDDEAELMARELAFLSSEPPPASSPSRTEVASSAGSTGSGSAASGPSASASATEASADDGGASDPPPAAKPSGAKKGGGKARGKAAAPAGTKAATKKGPKKKKAT